MFAIIGLTIFAVAVVFAFVKILSSNKAQVQIMTDPNRPATSQEVRNHLNAQCIKRNEYTTSF
ncbi:MAG: hypothetical protein CFH44_01108 [Proteobacteria bacterium]|nr:MAG: hypothetical protein CFH44_01108 [Pseudomonadota bacterium]